MQFLTKSGVLNSTQNFRQSRFLDKIENFRQNRVFKTAPKISDKVGF